MKILSVTTLFPNQAQPVHAVFVANRIQHMARYAEVKVICPIPYFPCDKFIAKYAERRLIPAQDRNGNVAVWYPRFLSIPAILKPLDGLFVLLAVWWTARKIRRTFDFDLLDTHLAFPDGFAGIFLGKLWRKPVTVTLRGHDINVLPTDEFPVRKKQIQFTLRNADLIIGVADALRRAAVQLGAAATKTVAISNGVDASKFFRVEQTVARQKLGLPSDRQIILSVGRIVENKGYHVIVEALDLLRKTGARIPYFVIVGGAADEALYPQKLRQTITQLQMQEHVLLAGPQLNETLRDWYSAADVYCLASRTEGWPNVLLESLACGTPVVATNIWGTPEIICHADYGLLVERDPAAIAQAIQIALQKNWEPAKLIAYAQAQSWDNVAQKILANFAKLVAPAPQ